MRLRFFATIGLVLSSAPALLYAQAPTSGWRAEFLGVFGRSEQKYVQLAEAMPWEKYSWRPGEGVRSVCEVYLHIAGENYDLAQKIGAKPVAGLDLKNMEKCPDSKDKVISTLKDSFTYFRNAVLAVSDADSEKSFTLFGQKMTTRGFLTVIAEHTGEHLGQSIAYARTNGVVPPWSAKGGM